MAATAAAAARASRLAQAELAVARAEVEAAAVADAARAAAAEVEDLRSSHSCSIAADDSADPELELLERDAARRRAAQWAAVHAHERGHSPDRRGGAGGAPGGGAHGNVGGRVEEEHGLRKPRGSLSPDRYRGGARGAPGGGAHGNGGGRVKGEHGLRRPRGSLPGPVPWLPRVPGCSKDVGLGSGWPTLPKTNYVEWAAVMKVRLQVLHMWETVRYGDVDYD